MNLKSINFIFSKKQKRADLNNNPFNLYVELLIVTDHSIFEDHKRFSKSENTDLVFLHMQTYFAHFINGVLLKQHINS